MLIHCLTFCFFILPFQDKEVDADSEHRFLLGSYAVAIDFVHIEDYLRGFFRWRRDQLVLLADGLEKSPSKKLNGVSLAKKNHLRISGKDAKYLMEPATALFLIGDGLLEPQYGSVLEDRLIKRGLSQSQVETIKDQYISLGTVTDFKRNGLKEISAPYRKYFNPKVPVLSRKQYGEILREIYFAQYYTLPETYAINFLLGLDVKTRAVLITYIDDVLLEGGNNHIRVPTPLTEVELRDGYAFLEESRERKRKEIFNKEK